MGEAPADSVEAQVKCNCGERDLVVTWTDAAEVGERVQVKMPCDGCGSLERTVTVVYDPEEYDLKDPYGPADFSLHAECEECGAVYHGVMKKPCYKCESESFERTVRMDT